MHEKCGGSYRSLVMIARWLVERSAGVHGKQVLERWRDKCAESSSPVLQIFYIILLAVGFYFYTVNIFCFLPQSYAPTWHMCDP